MTNLPIEIIRPIIKTLYLITYIIISEVFKLAANCQFYLHYSHYQNLAAVSNKSSI